MASRKKTVPVPEEGAATVIAAPETQVNLVICAYPGTEEKMRFLWRRALPADFGFKVVTVDETSECARDILTIILDDREVADAFALVPANTFPTSPVLPEELRMPVVYVDKKGRRQFAHRLPKFFDKTSLAELFSSPAYPDLDAEAFCKVAAEQIPSRPVAVGHSFGNFVTMVLRGSPCEHEVIAGMLPTSGRKYIAASLPGWNAIEHLIDEYIGRECP